MGLLQYTNQEYYEDGVGHGGYQFTSLKDIINHFIAVYVGEDKIISKVKRMDVAFHAQRALAELSFDTLKSCKAHEIILPNTLQMLLPKDYVNYIQVSWVDSAGIKHRIYPENKSSNPGFSPYINSSGDYMLNTVVTLTDGSNVFVLDGDYSDQLVHGMKFANHPYISPQSYIHAISTTSGITSVTIKNKAGDNDKPADIDGSGTTTASVELKLSRTNIIGLGRAVRGNTLVETTVSAAAVIGDTIISVSSVTGLKKGMFINHPSFVNSDGGSGSAASIVAIGSNEIEISIPATYDITASSNVSFLQVKENSDTWDNYKSGTPSENQDDYEDDTYWPIAGGRYGLDPQRAQVNGYFYQTCDGKLSFSSNMAGRTIILDYLSDTLGTDAEMQVHKFAEEAIYKWIMHAVLSSRANIPEYRVNRLKKERFAAIRTAKLRLSNIKLEEITQILRGKSKQIKH